MSRERRKVQDVTWYDEFGRRHDEVRIDKDPVSFASIPAKDRLVELYCPKGHLFGLVLQPEGGVPVVYINGDHLGPMLVLLPEGLAGAMVTYDTAPALVHAIGTPRASFPVTCPTCVKDFEVPAVDLDRCLAERYARRSSRAVRLSIGVASHDAVPE